MRSRRREGGKIVNRDTRGVNLQMLKKERDKLVSLHKITQSVINQIGKNLLKGSKLYGTSYNQLGKRLRDSEQLTKAYKDNVANEVSNLERSKVNKDNISQMKELYKVHARYEKNQEAHISKGRDRVNKTVYDSREEASRRFG